MWYIQNFIYLFRTPSHVEYTELYIFVQDTVACGIYRTLYICLGHRRMWNIQNFIYLFRTPSHVEYTELLPGKSGSG